MERQDALTLFDPKLLGRENRMPAPTPPLRVGILTEDKQLLREIEEALEEAHVSVEPLGTIDLALDRARTTKGGLTIVHLYRSDIWPGLAFHLFDADAEDRPVIILCDSPDEARFYLGRSERVIDILPVQAVRDHRFPSVIDAVMLRASSLAADHCANEPSLVA